MQARRLSTLQSKPGNESAIGALKFLTGDRRGGEAKKGF
jgi:hypothetical protein